MEAGLSLDGAVLTVLGIPLSLERLFGICLRSRRLPLLSRSFGIVCRHEMEKGAHMVFGWVEIGVGCVIEKILRVLF